MSRKPRLLSPRLLSYARYRLGVPFRRTCGSPLCAGREGHYTMCRDCARGPCPVCGEAPGELEAVGVRSWSFTYSLHCSSLCGLPYNYRILNRNLVKPKKGTTMGDSIGRLLGLRILRSFRLRPVSALCFCREIGTQTLQCT